MDYKKLLKAGKEILKVTGVMVAGGIGGALLNKGAGEIVELIPPIREFTKNIMDYFQIQGDIGNLFSLVGLLYGPNIAYSKLKEYEMKKGLEKKFKKEQIF